MLIIESGGWKNLHGGFLVRLVRLGTHLLDKVVQQRAIDLQADARTGDDGPVLAQLALHEFRCRVQSVPLLDQIFALEG